jgi:hypothetical protein
MADSFTPVNHELVIIALVQVLLGTSTRVVVLLASSTRVLVMVLALVQWGTPTRDAAGHATRPHGFTLTSKFQWTLTCLVCHRLIVVVVHRCNSWFTLHRKKKFCTSGPAPPACTMVYSTSTSTGTSTGLPSRLVPVVVPCPVTPVSATTRHRQYSTLVLYRYYRYVVVAGTSTTTRYYW